MTSTIPAAILDKMRPAEFSHGSRFEYFRLLEQLLVQIQDQIGVSQGEVKGVSNINGRIFIDGGENRDFDVVTTAAGFTTYGNLFVRVTSVGTTTLNSEPEDKEQAIIQPLVSGMNIVSGPINGGIQAIITKAYDCVTFEYSIDLGEWVIK